MNAVMTRADALSRICASIPDTAVVIAANGHVSRALRAETDSPRIFYMIGSMGLAPSIALGIARIQPQRLLVTLDGDGNVLMNLGALASIASAAPPRFVHLCLDNGQYASTGGQTVIPARFAELARAAGYAYSASCPSPEGLEAELASIFQRSGPSFLHIPILPGGLPKGTPRVEHSPVEMTRRLREALR